MLSHVYRDIFLRWYLENPGQVSVGMDTFLSPVLDDLMEAAFPLGLGTRLISFPWTPVIELNTCPGLIELVKSSCPQAIHLVCLYLSFPIWETQVRTVLPSLGRDEERL